MISFKVLLGVLFAALIASIAVLAVISYRNNKLLNQNAEMVQRTHEVLEFVNRISSSYKDIQLESNAYFLENDSSLLLPYRAAQQRVMSMVSQLKALTKENDRQRLRIDSLEHLIKEVVSFSDEVAYSRGNVSLEVLQVRVKKQSQLREQIRSVMNRIRIEENRLLEERRQAHQTSILAFDKGFAYLLAGIAILIGATFFSVRYNFNKRIKAETEQRKSNDLFTKLFYESPMGIVISRFETGEIIDCNKAYATLLNYDRSELIGRSAVELGILKSASQRNEMLGYLKSIADVREVEVQLNPKDKDPVWVSISMQSIEIEGEHCLMSAVLDMTSHKQAEQRISAALNTERELNKLKSNFVTLASHEFRTPLTTILSSSTLLENYSDGEHKDKVSKHVARIKASVNLLTSVLDEFLSLTKIEEGKVKPKTEEINLKQTIETLCGHLQTTIKPGQEIVYVHSGEEMIESDPVLLGNIVNNLVSNASKYSNEGSRIEIKSLVNASVHLSVKDNGIGISKDDQKHLFERFFRASNAVNIQGTGLGLHLIKHYIEMLNGSVDVISEPEKGTEFKITFKARSR